MQGRRISGQIAQITLFTTDELDLTRFACQQSGIRWERVSSARQRDSYPPLQHFQFDKVDDIGSMCYAYDSVGS